MRFPSHLTWGVLGLSLLVASSASATCPGSSCPSGLGRLLNGIGEGASVDLGINSRRRTSPAVPRASSTATRTANRELQTALNHFGYGAGAVDGVMGLRARAAISKLQTELNLPATGRLDPQNKAALIRAYEVSRQGRLARSPESIRAFMAGYLAANDGQRQVAAANAKPNVARTTNQQAATASIAVPVGTRKADVARVCALQFGISSTPKDAVTRNVVDRMCEKRISDMAAGRAALAKFGAIPERGITDYCRSVKALFEQTDTTNWKQLQSNELLAAVKAKLEAEGAQPASYAAVSQVCLGRGHEINDDEMVLASAVLLVASGDELASETVALHLSGATGRWQLSAVATDWFTRAFAAMIQAGETPAPSQRFLARSIGFDFSPSGD